MSQWRWDLIICCAICAFGFTHGLASFASFLEDICIRVLKYLESKPEYIKERMKLPREWHD